MPTLFCNRCPRIITPDGARRSLRDTGEQLCFACRRQRYPIHRTLHQAPHGCDIITRPEGYGRYSCELRAPGGRVFQGFGSTDELALSRARRKALEAGALP